MNGFVELVEGLFFPNALPIVIRPIMTSRNVAASNTQWTRRQREQNCIRNALTMEEWFLPEVSTGVSFGLIDLARKLVDTFRL